jgi:hypothetical protein
MQSPLSALHIHHLEGALKRATADDAAFGQRDSRFILNIVGLWPDPAESDLHTRWVRDTYAAIAPHATNGAYINFMGEEAPDRVRAAYRSASYERLVALKRTYDPGNLFRVNQNIRPD